LYIRSRRATPCPVGIALLADPERRAGADRHVLHRDAMARAVAREQIIQQAAVGGAGGGGDAQALRLRRQRGQEERSYICQDLHIYLAPRYPKPAIASICYCLHK
jgi:hypothetical protein